MRSAAPRSRQRAIRDPQPRTRLCATCGASFPLGPTTRRAKTCSDRCGRARDEVQRCKDRLDSIFGPGIHYQLTLEVAHA